MAALPLNQLTLGCSSVAEHLGFIALSDAAEAMGEQDGRIIGGQMISLLVSRWEVNLLRATQDADLGVRPAVVNTPDLTDRLLGMGYTRSAGNRFERPIEGLPAQDGKPRNAVIDILVPSYQTRVRENRMFGDHLVTTEVPGLASALQKPAIDLEVQVRMLDEESRTIPVRLPDEVGALILKLMARTVRDEDKDAVDVWRALEVCHAAGLSQVDLGSDRPAAHRILESQFRRGGSAIEQIAKAQNLSTQATAALETRIQALSLNVVGDM